MKCIQDAKTGEISRVSNDGAEHAVKCWPNEYRYVPKSGWKAQEAAKRIMDKRSNALSALKEG